MGWASAADPLGIFNGSSPQSTAATTAGQGGSLANLAVTQNMQAAQDALTAGQKQATTAAKSGFNTALGDTTSGYNTAQQQLQSGYTGALNTAQQGFNQAQAATQSPNMVQSRQDLYNQLLGNGGLSPGVLNQMESGARQEYGTGLRGAEQATSQFLGDSEARGLAGEEVAQAAAALGAQRANTVSGIEVQNAQLAEQEKQAAIQTSMSDAYQQAGLDAQSAEYVSGLQEKMAEGGANLTAQETNALSTLAAQEGTTLSGLITSFSQGHAALSAEEAQALANISLGTATNIAQLQATPTGMGALLGMNT